MLEQIVRRCKTAQTIDDVLVACPLKDELTIFQWTGILPYPGPEQDVLTRLLDAARSVHATHFIRVTGDNPFVCPKLIDQMVGHQALCKKPVIVNWKKRTLPDGLDLECYEMDWLERLGEKLVDQTDREYFAQYIIERFDKKIVESLANRTDLSRRYRLTVDYPEDLAFARAVYNWMEEEIWDSEKLILFLDKHPEIMSLNRKWIDGNFGARPK